jgi:hypothetical protein
MSLSQEETSILDMAVNSDAKKWNYAPGLPRYAFVNCLDGRPWKLVHVTAADVAGAKTPLSEGVHFVYKEFDLIEILPAHQRHAELVAFVDSVLAAQDAAQQHQKDAASSRVHQAVADLREALAEA